MATDMSKQAMQNENDRVRALSLDNARKYDAGRLPPAHGLRQYEYIVFREPIVTAGGEVAYVLTTWGSNHGYGLAKRIALDLEVHYAAVYSVSKGCFTGCWVPMSRAPWVRWESFTDSECDVPMPEDV